jgi:hypothetical protein
MVADPPRLLHACATSDGGAAVDGEPEYSSRGVGAADAAISTVTPRFASYESRARHCDRFRGHRRSAILPQFDREACLREAGVGPQDLSLAEVYDFAASLDSTGTNISAYASRGREAPLRSDATRVGGRIP